jgi:hypothetical protein
MKSTAQHRRPEQPDFYVGYQPTAPPAVARFLRPVLLLLLIIVLAVAVDLTCFQKPFDPGVFEFGATRELEGVLVANPYPELRIDRPGLSGGAASGTSRYLLVAPGKRGAFAAVQHLDGQRVRLRGTLVYRDSETMLELVPGSIRPANAATRSPAPAEGPEEMGWWTLRGEIVDAKCFLGVMKPGREKPHRACAVRCISGGVPPVLVVETGGGERSYLVLIDAQGQAVNQRVLDYVAEPIEIGGHLRRQGDRLLLFADLGTLRRISE